MASAAASIFNTGVLLTLSAVAGVASAGYAGYAAMRADWVALATDFLTGPGRTSRILLTVFVLTNLKSMPFGWTFRIFAAMLRHTLKPRRPLTPRALFHPSITSSRTSLLEVDYNFHKSNSTYFADLDASRSHLVMHLLAPGIKAVGENARTKLVPLPPTPGEENPAIRYATGALGVGLGAVFCTFRREIAPWQRYEMWSRVLAWDRKWLYIVTHFVVAGKVKPASWDGGSYWGQSGGLRRRGPKKQEGASGDAGETTQEDMDKENADLQKYVIATAVSKYVFKLGRFTVHPAYLLEASGLLPERPGGDGGWRGGEAGVGDEACDLGDVVVDDDGEWDWRRIERERRRGMELAAHFAALDGTAALFDGGREGALGRFGPG